MVMCSRGCHLVNDDTHAAQMITVNALISHVLHVHYLRNHNVYMLWHTSDLVNMVVVTTDHVVMTIRSDIMMSWSHLRFIVVTRVDTNTHS